MKAIDSEPNVTDLAPRPDKINVLVVDDHPALAHGLAEWLSIAPDINVVGLTHDGPGAIEAIESLSPDVVLLDLVLDDSPLNGVDVIKLIHQMHRQPKILVLSGFYEPKHVFGAIDAGVNGYVLKTSDHTHILQSIRTVKNGKTVLDPKVLEILLHYLGKYSLHDGMSDRDSTKQLLTKREWEVLEHIAARKTVPEIAAELHIAEATIKTHQGNILKKLQLNDRAQAGVWYQIVASQGLLDD